MHGHCTVICVYCLDFPLHFGLATFASVEYCIAVMYDSIPVLLPSTLCAVPMTCIYPCMLTICSHMQISFYSVLRSSTWGSGERSQALTENVRLGRSQVELSYASSPLTMTSWMISVMLHVNASTFNVQLFNLGNGQQTSARFAAMFAIPK